MGRIADRTIEEVRDRTSIVQVVGEYVRLQRRGTRMVGLCPFHNEKTPSFHVNDDRRSFHCFGCGASGDVFRFLTQHTGLSFPEAVRQMADRCGIEIEESSGVDDAEQRRRRDARERYFRATAFARELWESRLWTGGDKQGLEYLRGREIKEETARAFGIGYALPGWSDLVDAAERRGISGAELEMAGLAMERRGGGHYDRFRHRVMFPIMDLTGRAVAFSGRTLDPEERAKYINSPETAFYTKGRNLFGLAPARKGIRERKAAVLVEGNFDVLAMHAAGINHVCAPLGTALTADQARLLRRFTDRVVILFDGDAAGREAARKALFVLLEAEVPEVLFAALPRGADPADLLEESTGKEQLEDIVSRARPMLDVCVDEAVRPAVGGGTGVDKRVALGAAAEVITHIRDKFLWRRYVEQVARRLEIPDRDVAEFVRSAASRPPLPPDPDPEELRIDTGLPEEPAPEIAALNEFERMLVRFVHDRPRRLERIFREQLFRIVGHEELSALLERAANGWVREGRDFRTLVDAMPDDGLRSQIFGVLAGGAAFDSRDTEADFDALLVEIKAAWAGEEIRRWESEVARLDREGLYEEMFKAQERVNALMRFLPS